MASAMEKFEGVFVGYMLNQARMPFAMVSMYPHYRIQEGKLVVDNSETSQTLREEAGEIRDLICRISNRYRKNIRIPRTWRNRVAAQSTLVDALREHKVITQEWCDEFYRTVRYFATLD